MKLNWHRSRFGNVGGPEHGQDNNVVGANAHSLLRHIRPEFVLWTATMTFFFSQPGGWGVIMGRPTSWVRPGYDLLNQLGYKTQTIIIFTVAYSMAWLPLIAYRWLTKDSSRLGRYLDCFFLWATSFLVASALASRVLEFMAVYQLEQMIYASGKTAVPYGVFQASIFAPTMIDFLPGFVLLVLAKDIILKNRWTCYATNLVLAILMTVGCRLAQLLVN